MTSLNAAGVQHAKVIDSVATDRCFASCNNRARRPYTPPPLAAAPAAAAAVASSASSLHGGIHLL